MSRTNTALLFATEWHVVVKNIVLINPDLNKPDKFHRSAELILYLTVPASRAEDTR
jgi:hypothetical protein